MHAISAAIGKDVSICIHWLLTWLGAHVLALYKGWKIALACMSFSPLIMLIGAFTMRVGNLVPKSDTIFILNIRKALPAQTVQTQIKLLPKYK